LVDEIVEIIMWLVFGIEFQSNYLYIRKVLVKD